MRFELLEETFDNLPSVWLHFIASGDNVGVFFDSIVIELFRSLCSKNDLFEEVHNFLHWEVVRILWKFMKEVDIFIQNKTVLALEDGINEKIDVRLFENMGNLLEQSI